jgi:hypothetical protein
LGKLNVGRSFGRTDGRGTAEASIETDDHPVGYSGDAVTAVEVAVKTVSTFGFLSTTTVGTVHPDRSAFKRLTPTGNRPLDGSNDDR